MQAPFSPILIYFNIVTEYHVSSIAVICLVFEALELALLAKSAEENLFHLDIQDSESLVQYLIGALLCLLYQRSFEIDVTHTKSSLCRMLELLPFLHQNIPERLAVNMK